MKRQQGSLATVLVFGASVLGLSLGLGPVAHAQRIPDHQQAEEIPPQYEQYPPQGGGPPPVYAQQPGDPQQQGQSDSGAARLSYIRGDVTTQHSDSGDWMAATLNTPVVSGDHVSTGNGARAEIELDHANILRMADQTTANIVSLSPTQMQLQIGQGLANFEVLRGSEADIEIQTPNVAIHPQMGEGSFRILVNSDGETIIDVRKGSAEVSTPQGSTRVDRNQRITIQGDADNAQYRVSGAPGTDEWDRWNSDRDHTITSAESWQHTNPYYTGSQDLDGYGQWNDVPDYGSVWFPQADAGWAPYRDGRWVFEPYYGWTWVSYEPWGWAPYHYGRWFVYDGRWGWWPGPVYGGYRPIWAPAYVSFLGFGGGGWGFNFGFGSGFGSIGWLPCGPGDRFYPWYGRGVNRVNVVNVYNAHNSGGGFAPLRGGGRGFSNVDRAFTDGRVRDGVSSMASNQFGRGRVPAQQQRFDAGTFRQASVMTGANPVSPSRESFRSSDRQVSPNTIPNRAATSQRFFSGNDRQGGQSGFARGGNPSGGQPQQNNGRPGFRSFGSNNSGNSGDLNPGTRQGGFNSRGYQAPQNTARPSPEQTARPDQGNSRGQRGFTPQPSQQAPANQYSRPDPRSYAPPSRESQPYGGGRTFEGQGVPQPRANYPQPTEPPRQYQNYSRGNSSNGRVFEGQGVPQSRANYPQPSEPPRQYQDYSRGNPGNSGYSRPPLNMQQPVVTPRGGGYNSAPPPRSAPTGGGNSGRGYQGGPPSGGGSRGGSSEGNSRGGGGNSGGDRSSGHGRH